MSLRVDPGSRRRAGWALALALILALAGDARSQCMQWVDRNAAPLAWPAASTLTPAQP